MTGSDTTEQLYSVLLANIEKLFNLAYSILQNQADAEDVIQDTYLRIFNKKIALKPDTANDGSPVGFLFKIIRNASFDRLKWKKRDLVCKSMGHSGLDCVYRWPSSLSQLELTEVQTQILDSVPQNRRELLIMLFKGMALSEIAVELGVSPKIASVRIHRLRNDFLKPFVVRQRLHELVQISLSGLTQLEEYDCLIDFMDQHGTLAIDAIERTAILERAHHGFRVKCHQVVDNYIAENYKTLNISASNYILRNRASTESLNKLDPRATYISFATEAANGFKIAEMGTGNLIPVVNSLHKGLIHGPLSGKFRFSTLRQTVQDASFVAFAIGCVLDARARVYLNGWQMILKTFEKYRPQSRVSSEFHSQFQGIDVSDGVAVANIRIPSLLDFEWSIRQMVENKTCREMFSNRHDVTSPASEGLNRY